MHHIRYAIIMCPVKQSRITWHALACIPMCYHVLTLIDMHYHLLDETPRMHNILFSTSKTCYSEDTATQAR